MTVSRRTFLGAAAGLTASALSRTASGAAPHPDGAGPGSRPRAGGPADAGILDFPGRGSGNVLSRRPADRFDPWVEVDAAALAHNAAVVSRLAGGRPILAVVKNNAYGLGLDVAPSLLEPLDAIGGFAVVTADAAIALRDAGVRKPVLLMGMASEGAVPELAARAVQLSLYTDDDVRRLSAAARERPVDAHFYLDTGMGRMGMPYHRALAWMAEVAGAGVARIRGTFMAFTEEPEFDREQLRRFTALVADARARGLEPGALHAASSNAVFHLPDAHLDMVRPGIALWGAYPSRPDEERRIATLRPAARLCARVVRVARLRPGDTVSYGRNYTAERETWIATLPAGHADGYPRDAVKGARVLIGGRLFPVIGAVSASHTIVELGAEPAAAVGDVATLMGPDVPAIEPNRLADAIGVSVYDLLMHLNPTLPRAVA